MFHRSSSRAGRLVVVALLGLTAAFGLASCGDSSSDSGNGDITVFAAASLTEAFTELGKIYEQEHAGSKVVFSFAGSSDLAAQIKNGAPADVFASADKPNMDKVVADGDNVGEPVDFAANVLEIAVPKGNPGKVSSLTDLADRNLKVAVCAPEVPCGNAAKQLFKVTGVKAGVDTYEPDVKSVLTKVELGEADAGLVYHTDVIAAGDRIDSIPIPETGKVVNTYPIVAVDGGGNPKGGQDFVELVTGEKGQTELKKWGFRSP